MCHDARLYQIDLLNGSRNRVTEREYWAKKKGQLALDEENAVLAEQGLPVKQMKFETDKDKLREEIRTALSDAISFEDFSEKLLRRGITVKESRGRLSYLTPDRTRPVTARKLGDDFDKAAVFAVFVRNAKRVRKHLLFILRPLSKTVSVSKMPSVIWWIWKWRKKKAGVMRIGQRPTISKI